METQAISAPVERLTREAPKRQVGYGLPCAKCHKYFPADLEVCPICKGRERVSPIVAPKIKKPVQSETSVAASSTNVALKQDVKESPKSESPALAPPVEIKVKGQPVDHNESKTTPVVAEVPTVVELARTSPVSTQPILSEEEKETPKSESPAAVAQIEVQSVEVLAEAQPVSQKESITIPALTEVPETIEPAPDNAVAANDASLISEMESPTVATSAADSVKCLDPLQELTVFPVLAEARPSTLVDENITPVQEEELSKEQVATTFSVLAVENTSLNDQPDGDPINQQEPIMIPALVEAQASDPVPAAAVPMREEKELMTELEAPAAADPVHTAIEERRLDNQRRDQINEALRIVIPMLVEAQASDLVPTSLTPEHKVGELPNEPEAPALDLPKQIAVEEAPNRICHPETIVIPALVETKASEPALVTAEQEVHGQEKKAEIAEILETPMSSSEEKIVEAKVVEVKTVELPAVFDQASRSLREEKSKAIEKGSDAPPKPANVNAPVVVHVNLGELHASKGMRERASAREQSKEIEYTELEKTGSDTVSDADAAEPPAPVSGRRVDLVTFALGVVVLACAVLLITLAAIRLMPRHASEPVRRAKAAYSSAPTTEDQNTNAAIPTPSSKAAAPENSTPSNSSAVVAPSPALAQPPAPSASNLPSANSARVLTLPEGLAEGNLLYRVEPDYPEEARRQGVQGPVVLDLHIGKDGLVQGADLVSGHPLLAQAATAAVKQWRFRTRYVNGNEVEMQARITLHFALPTP